MMMKGVQCYTNKPPQLHPIRNILKPHATNTNNNSNKNTNNKSSSSITIITEIRVCTNKPCRRQSSAEILHTLSNISPPHVSVTPCGCLGSCGSGPNLVLLPGPFRVKHCSTPARAARTLFDHVVIDDNKYDAEQWINNSLMALALRKRAEEELGEGGDFGRADELLSQAINLKPCGGVHFLYKARSDARLRMGNIAEALEDAQEAITQAPKYTEAYICQADALMALDEYDVAEKSYAIAVELDSSLFRSKSFKARIVKLQEKLLPVDSQ